MAPLRDGMTRDESRGVTTRLIGMQLSFDLRSFAMGYERMHCYVWSYLIEYSFEHRGYVKAELSLKANACEGWKSEWEGTTLEVSASGVLVRAAKMCQTVRPMRNSHSLHFSTQYLNIVGLIVAVLQFVLVGKALYRNVFYIYTVRRKVNGLGNYDELSPMEREMLEQLESLYKTLTAMDFWRLLNPW